MPKFERPNKKFAPAGSFGHLLATARRRREMSISEVALLSGLSQTFIHNIEIGQRAIDPNKVPDLELVPY